ncbi:2-dehydro-3-deoxyphosphogluconate aldolase [Geobacillus sp. 46C-IIa]|uniref:bifunctional 4-hydroxy-2-oxoglutarate aldolase/2-dehydro-3-deoxy-phosphogluconate aldolase n=1 Tax=Geobacillus sp. 46C-IIa TaxID=1963025 RepID=UPI0009BEB716|nr:bifunctional 4-hydroxy-2-oxoglutarate aldolase/2-dehydro-3-deoxy-phosphogluconate aldolase [Geobacillus sp. 46C-IIa]OQP06133.1 2-dehydro-3-deoxyphosphogluconate aldolase [Geobacillus sp. 46C-IIa]QNU29352.1 bifunctional 4-hydroxy-2-oxoglutarate aldolase/2-dehydro-3-deoxy-phosphogluconate aldolase [Geobacillus sp. 46C-IIa]
MNALAMIKDIGIVPVVRGATPDRILRIASALQRGGIPILEITMETDRALEALERAVYKCKDMVIGAGTVLDAETAWRAIAAGAQFIVSPSLTIDVIEVAKQHHLAMIAGGLTPTEIVTAFQHGADMVKVFPAHVFGPSYIRSLKEPLSHIPLIATGGIQFKTVVEYIKAGVDAVGVGNALVTPRDGVSEGQWEEMAVRAAQWVSVVQTERRKNAKGGSSGKFGR